MTGLVLFWGAAAVVAYTYGGYPLILLVRVLVHRDPVRGGDVTPSVTVVIAARNEAAAISARIANLLSLGYPEDRLEIVVASDGSTDGTDEIVRACPDARVRLLSRPRGGKAAALNAAVEVARGEILVFTDANTRFVPGALRALVRPFADARVGGVAGDQRYTNVHGEGQGERAFWSLDRFLKRLESASGSVISATGAIYAVRRGLFEAVPAGATDDFFVSTGVVRRGYRLVFAPEAVAYEPVEARIDAEFRRKVRVITRGFRSLSLRRDLLDPGRHGFYAVQVLSHKVLRRLQAVPFLVVAATTPFVFDHGLLYQAAAAGQASCYALGAAGCLLAGTRVGRLKPFAIPAFFLRANAASLLAAANAVTGRTVGLWEPDRASPGQPAPEGPRAPGVTGLSA